MRLTRALSLAVLMALLVACGGGPGASQSSTDSEQSTAADPSTAASEDAGASATPAGGNGGDVEGVAEALIPPNSTEVSKTVAEGVSFIIYESTDSIESLQSHYESAIPAAGMQISARAPRAVTSASSSRRTQGRHSAARSTSSRRARVEAAAASR